MPTAEISPATFPIEAILSRSPVTTGWKELGMRVQEDSHTIVKQRVALLRSGRAVAELMEAAEPVARS
jgi:hypothetical protein